MTTLVEENKYITFDHSYRLISVENNIGYHAQTEQKFIWRGTEAFRQEMAQSITENRAFFINFVRRFFPVQFGITEVKGSHVKLAAYQPVGALTKDDKVYIYHYGNEKALYQGQEEEFNVLKLLAIGDNFRLDGGYLVAKTDNAIKSAENTFACLTEKTRWRWNRGSSPHSLNSPTIHRRAKGISRSVSIKQYTAPLDNCLSWASSKAACSPN